MNSVQKQLKMYKYVCKNIDILKTGWEDFSHLGKNCMKITYMF